MIIIELLLMFCLPALMILFTKRSKIMNMIGAIALCYGAGFLISALPIPLDKGTTETVASVLVAIAIPLILFSFDIRSIRFLTKKTLIGFSLMIVSVMLVSSVAAIIGSRSGLSEAGNLAGMSTGLYIGGTPNLFSIGKALLDDTDMINAANVSDSLVGGIYILFVFLFLHKLYRRFLGSAGNERTEQKETDTAFAGDYDFGVIGKDRKSILRLAAVILLAVLCLGVGVLIELLVNGNIDGSLYIIVTVSVLGILLSFIRPVRETKGTYQIGQYLILIFSLGLGMSVDFTRFAADMIPVLIFFTCVQLASILLHFILCKIFRVDGGTALITCIAGIFGPPFIAPTANAYGDRDLILPGVICGTLGLVIGNLAGILLGSVLSAIL